MKAIVDISFWVGCGVILVLFIIEKLLRMDRVKENNEVVELSDELAVDPEGKLIKPGARSGNVKNHKTNDNERAANN